MASAEELDWDDLRYFLHAVRHKTFAAAARALNVEHTTIGRRLTALEQALGAPLILRGRDGLHLTPLGERVLPLVEEVERADHPGLELELLSGARAVDLKKGEADLAIRVGPLDDEELIARKLGLMGWALYASEKYLARRAAPADAEDLTGHDLIGYDASLAALPAARWVEARAATATIVLRNREMTDMLAAAASGVGLAVLPCWLAGADPSLKRLSSGVIATRAMALVYRRETGRSEAVRAVIDFVIDVMNEHAVEIAGD